MVANQKNCVMNVDFKTALKVWARIGILSFGGPAGQIALLHKELVEERQWMGEKEFLRALNFCMLLPGPEAMQLATYCGWKLHGQKGGLVAGLLFVLPGACLIFALSMIYAVVGTVPLVQALFWGVKAAVVAIVFEALFKIARKALRRPLDWLLATGAFIALFAFGLPFLLVISAAAIFGFFWNTVDQPVHHLKRPSIVATLRTIAIWLFVWLLPLAMLHAIYGDAHVFTRLGTMFSTLAVVTFGGAYAVLASLAQTVVEQTGWLTTAQLMDGFGLAETTPGPLILVGQFVAFTAANGVEKSLWAGAFGSLVFLWMTFTPCFLWIFAGAPWIDWLDSWPRLRSALSAITAAVTGVILNLSLWFALHVIFGRAERLQGPLPLWWPDIATFDLASLVLVVIFTFALVRLKAGIPKTLALGLFAGLLWLAIRNVI
jgi:chromate transporter